MVHSSCILDLDIANYKTLLTKYVGIQLIQIERQCIYLYTIFKTKRKSYSQIQREQ